MSTNNDFLKIKLNDHIFGYKVNQILKLKEIDSTFYLLNHKKTGAQHIHIQNSDSENTFGVIFKTVPLNSTGVAHILEHTVLCGSLNFPVKDPFFSMLKRSLATFMNAFTASDWTMYPFSTQNKKDFYNLLTVYMDSVLFPNIDILSFKQEGWRIDFENPLTKKNLVFKGIVYNEMKGAMSSPDQIMIRSLLNSLYPDTTYSNNSGGDPLKIPHLSYSELKKFHKKHYHPSNSFFYTYGNLPLDKHLEYLDKNFLSNFSQINPCVDVPKQPRWKKQKTAYYYYPFPKTENPEKKYQISLAWLTADIKNTYEVLVISILEQLLLGNSASPLRKALMDSNLGSSLSDGTGYDSENRDTMFACGLKDVRETDSEKIETLIINTLVRLSEDGIDPILIDSVLHQIEFSRKERTNNPYPFGLKLLLGTAACWLHGGNPGDVLQIDKNLNKIKKQIKSNNLFEKKIKEYFIENKHRVLLILKPDQKLEKKKNEKIKKILSKIRLEMSISDIEKIKSDSTKLDNLRKKSEDLSCLPTLQVEDIPKNIKIIAPPIKISSSKNTLIYNQSTSGIVYFYALIGVGFLKENILPLIPFFCHSLPRVGTSYDDYVKMAKEIDLYTGGLNLTPHPRIIFNSKGKCIPFISFSSKCLIRNKDKMIELVQKMISSVNFSDHNRVIQLLFEYKSTIESMIVHRAHNLAINLASRNFSDATYLNEIWSGITQFHTIKSIVENIKNKNTIKIFTDKLHYISKSIFFNNNSKVALIGNKSDLFSISKTTENIFNSTSQENKTGFEITNLNLNNKYFYEGWATSTSVSFVAQTFETVKLEHNDSPALAVISKIIRSLYLHKEIREKGGAYGGFCIYNSENGLFSFCSYRDPHIVKTIDVYNQIHNFILSNKLKDEDIKEAILQVCAEIDKPDSPGIAAKKDFLRKIIKLNDSFRQQYKTKLLNLDKKHITNISEKYFCGKNFNKSIAVISNKELLDAANENSTGLNLKIRTI